MTLSSKKVFFRAGGLANKEVEITNITYTNRAEVIYGRTTLPLSTRETDVVIYSQVLANGNTEYRTVSAKCPHQGADIREDELKLDGNVYCSLHRRPICIFSEYNYAFLVEKRDDRFFIVKSES